jgi:hypothetical protein
MLAVLVLRSATVQNALLMASVLLVPQLISLMMEFVLLVKTQTVKLAAQLALENALIVIPDTLLTLANVLLVVLLTAQNALELTQEIVPSAKIPTT